jgi:signal transduction histidine kinase
MLGHSLSLRAQLLMAFVVVVVGTTAGLTIDAYRSSLASFENDARRSAVAAANARVQAINRMLNNRQRRASGFLTGTLELCGEPTKGRYAWALDCVEPMLEAFRAAEGASGASVEYRGRLLARSGTRVSAFSPRPDALAHVTWEKGQPAYVMLAKAGDLAITVQFDGTDITSIINDPTNLGSGGEVLLLDKDGRFLSRARFGRGDSLDSHSVSSTEPVMACTTAAGQMLGVDYRGIRTIHAYQLATAIEGACVDAHVNYAEAMAPAERLRGRLVQRGALFIIIGALFSLFASHRIAAPVQRLATAARALRSRLDEPIPVGGPSEVRDLGRALRETADDVAALVTREQTARREAQSANSAKDQFLAAVSHELRTPLTAILGWARVMRSQPLPDLRSERALAAIERSAQAQRRLIEDLLDVSRIVAGQLRVERQPVHLATVIERALDAIRPLAIEKKIELQTVIENTMLTLEGDAERLQQVVWNLTSNAVKFTAPGGTVMVALRRVGNGVELSVCDNGIGITEEFLPHVFEWFRQDNSVADRSRSGLGLGLGIVRQLVEVHGGTVSAESEGEGRGARFTVTLPLEAQEHAVTAAATAM